MKRLTSGRRAEAELRRHAAARRRRGPRWSRRTSIGAVLALCLGLAWLAADHVLEPAEQGIAGQVLARPAPLGCGDESRSEERSRLPA